MLGMILIRLAFIQAAGRDQFCFLFGARYLNPFIPAKMFAPRIGNGMICSDIWHTTSDISKLLCVISRADRRVKFETILKYHEWYLCQISRTNPAIICLHYFPQKVCNFHMQVFQIKLKYHCSKPIKLQKFLTQKYQFRNSNELLG